MSEALLAVQDHEPIRGDRLIFRFSIFSRVSVIALIAVALLCTTAVSLRARDGSKDWITLDNCQLVPNNGNDGDSFHVRANDTEYLVRLYFVDAPETASVGPERLIEQAQYFGLSVPQVIEIGRDAKKFVDARLSEPFSVVTRLAGGLGRSKVQRIYGFVRTKKAISANNWSPTDSRESTGQPQQRPEVQFLPTNAKNSQTGE